jgi:hypothetical protein
VSDAEALAGFCSAFGKQILSAEDFGLGEPSNLGESSDRGFNSPPLKFNFPNAFGEFFL